MEKDRVKRYEEKIEIILDRKMDIEEIKKDFSFLKGEISALLLYGSQAKGTATPRSDVDIFALLRKVWQNLGNKYDARIFEDLPLYLKADILNNHIAVWANNLPDLYEYFYHFRKLWMEQKHRQEVVQLN